MTSGPHQVHIQATNSAEPDRSVSSRRTSGRDKTAGQPRGGTQRDHREGPLNPQVLGSSPRGVRTKALVRTLTRAFQVLRRGVRNPILHLRCLTPSVTPRLHLDTWGAALSESLRNRFEAKVDRSGEHNAWTGSRTSDGAGKLKVDGKTVSARRVTWEFARGALAAGVVVKACPAGRPSVRAGRAPLLAWRATAAKRRRAPRGSGSKTEIRAGVWKLRVTSGRYADGRVRRLHRTVQANTEAQATRELATMKRRLLARPRRTS